MDLDDYVIATDRAESHLNQRQLLDYRSERSTCLEWLPAVGKDPDKAVGYAPGTIKNQAYRHDKFYRFVWTQENGYTANVSHDHADAWMDHLARQDCTQRTKSTVRRPRKPSSSGWNTSGAIVNGTPS